MKPLEENSSFVFREKDRSVASSEMREQNELLLLLVARDSRLVAEKVQMAAKPRSCVSG